MPPVTASPTPPWKVLVFPAVTEVAAEIARSLEFAKEVEGLIGASADAQAAVHDRFDAHVEVPHVSDPRWSAAIKHLVGTVQPDFIFPAHDDALVALTSPDLGLRIPVIGPDHATAQLTRSKSATYRVLAGVVRTPKVVRPREFVSCSYPLFAKPDQGEGSRGAMRIDSDVSLEFALESGSTLITEYLPGPEYTIDCFSDSRAGLLYAFARTRTRVRNGISVDSRPVNKQERFWRIAEKVSRGVPMRGPWFLQVRESEAGDLCLLEIAGRIAGTMGLSRARGVNLPLLALYERAGVTPRIHPLTEAIAVQRPLAEIFVVEAPVEHIYVDLDDTLIVRGRLNARLVHILALARDRSIPITLITRHSADPERTVTEHGVRELFSSIAHVQRGVPKSSVIPNRLASFFVDDSFQEREEVRAAGVVWAIDCSMLGVLEAAVRGVE
jgi:carbamoyl-phosphate synthase large subunit